MKNNVDLTVDRDFRNKHHIPVYRKRVPWRNEISHYTYDSGSVSFEPIVFDINPNTFSLSDDLFEVFDTSAFRASLSLTTNSYNQSNLRRDFVKDPRVPWRKKESLSMINAVYQYDDDTSVTSPYRVTFYTDMNGNSYETSFIDKVSINDTVDESRSSIIKRHRINKYKGLTKSVLSQFKRIRRYFHEYVLDYKSMSHEIIREFEHSAARVSNVRHHNENRYITRTILDEFKMSRDNLDTNIVERDTRWR